MTDFEHKKLDDLKAIFADDSYKDDLDDDDYMVLASKIADAGDAGIGYLTDILNNCNETRARAILFAITRSKKNRKETVKLLSSYLDDKRPLVISEAIDGLICLDDKSGQKKIMSLLTHHSEYVRGAVLRYARHTLNDKKSFQILIASLDDPHYIVRENAVDELADLGKAEAVPHISALLGDPHPHVRLAAHTAVEELSDDQAEEFSPQTVSPADWATREIHYGHNAEQL